MRRRGDGTRRASGFSPLFHGRGGFATPREDPNPAVEPAGARIAKPPRPRYTGGPEQGQ